MPSSYACTSSTSVAAQAVFSCSKRLQIDNESFVPSWTPFVLCFIVLMAAA